MSGLIQKLTYTAVAALETININKQSEIVKVKNGSLRDVVTKLDIDINEALVNEALNFQDDIVIFSEEKFVNHACKIPFKDLTVVIDPLDGSHNFKIGLPFYCVLISIVENNKVLGASIISPLTNDIVILDGAKLISSNSIGRFEGVGPTYFAYPPRLMAEKPELTMRIFQKIDENSTGIYRWGSAGLGLLSVLKGELQTFVGVEVRLWDVLSGLTMLVNSEAYVAYKFLSQEVITVVISWKKDAFDDLCKNVFDNKAYHMAKVGEGVNFYE